jgi:uncharacterized protein (TIGR02099 family)
VYLLAAVAILLSGIALVLRLAVMPEIGRYRADLETLTSQAVGMPVRIGSIEADWWRINPRLGLNDVELLPPGRSAPLVLPKVNATLSWLSLLVWEPRLARLDLFQPMLEARRDPAGVIYVAGIPVNQSDSQSPFPDWLLRQHDVTVTDGRLLWRDEMLGAPPLTLDQLNLRLVNRLGHHRFGLTARPPADSIQSLDIRGDLQGKSVHDWGTWRGRLYQQVRQASAKSLLRWAPWAQQQVKEGHGDVRVWMDLEGGKVVGVSGDMRLGQVAVSLAEDLPDMRFQTLSGHLDWRMEKGEHILEVERLHFVSETGQRVAPAQVRIKVKPTTDGKVESAQVNVSGLRLEALTALSHAVPLPRRLQSWIARHNPRGFIETVDVTWQGQDRFHIKTRFQDAGMNATGELPGFSGLDGEIEADDSMGRVRLASKGLFLTYAPVFRQPLTLQALDARLGWVKTATGGHRITLERASLSNSDLEGHVYGSLETVPGQAPIADIRAQLKRGEGAAVWKYLPHQAGDDAYHWVKRSVRGGSSPDTRLVLRGPLDRFPFNQGEGEFLVAVKLDSAVLDYAPGWPSIRDIQGWLVFKGPGLTVTTTQGRILDVPLGPVKATIADLMDSANSHLAIDGSAEGPTADFLALIRASPVFEYTNRFTEPFQAEGSAKLRLHLDLPLHDIDASRVSGQIRLDNNRLATGQGLPTLTGITGSLAFSEKGINGEDIGVRILDDPAILNLVSEEGGQVRVTLEGRMQAKALAAWLPAKIVRRLSGSASYRAEVGLRKQQTVFNVDSDLVGLGIQLPPPFGKPATQGRRLSVQASPHGAKGDDHIRLRFGDLLSASLLKPGEPDARVGVTLGTGDPVLPGQPGIQVRGALQKLDLDSWQALWEGETGDTTASPPIRDVNLTFNEVKVFNRRFHDTHVHASPVPGGWRLRLAGQELQGEVVYDEPGGLPGSRLVGRFQKLVLPKAEIAASALAGSADAPMEMPRIIDINAQAFTYTGHHLGSLVTLMEAEGNGLLIRNLSLTVPEGRLEGTGWLSASTRRPTELALKLDASDTGRLLTRLGLPEGIKGGATALSGDLSWMGRFEDFELAKLNGRLKMELKRGRFSRLDPGVGRLLGIFSLQSLPRRITLDFRDIFSEGFAFDSIEGDVHIERGALYLPALQINGPAGKVRMNGKVDTVAETQSLRLLIQPRLDESAAVAGALLGGPVVGLGALVATKLLQDPIGKAASFEYLVTGSWDEPNVVKMAKTQPSLEALP